MLDFIASRSLRKWGPGGSIDANQGRGGYGRGQDSANELKIVGRVFEFDALGLQGIQREHVTMSIIRRPWTTIAATVTRNAKRNEVARKLARLARQGGRAARILRQPGHVRWNVGDK